MTANAIIETQGRCLNVASNTLGKLLWVARSHGWRPEKKPKAARSRQWDTELTAPSLEDYLDGTVSKTDAQGLGNALRRILSCGDSEMSSSMYLTLLMLLRVADHGSFVVHPAAEAPSEVDEHAVLAGAQD